MFVFVLVMSPCKEGPMSDVGKRGMLGLVLGKVLRLFEPGFPGSSEGGG